MVLSSERRPASLVSKAPFQSEPINRTRRATGGSGVKSKCLNREEFVVVGWTDPEGSRSHIGALLLGYYTEDGRLHYAGRAGTGPTGKELKCPRQEQEGRASRGRLCDRTSSAGEGAEVIHQPATLMQESGR